MEARSERFAAMAGAAVAAPMLAGGGAMALAEALAEPARPVPAYVIDSGVHATARPISWVDDRRVLFVAFNTRHEPKRIFVALAIWHTDTSQIETVATSSNYQMLCYSAVTGNISYRYRKENEKACTYVTGPLGRLREHTRADVPERFYRNDQSCTWEEWPAWQNRAPLLLKAQLPGDSSGRFRLQPLKVDGAFGANTRIDLKRALAGLGRRPIGGALALGRFQDFAQRTGSKASPEGLAEKTEKSLAPLLRGARLPSLPQGTPARALQETLNAAGVRRFGRDDWTPVREDGRIGRQTTRAFATVIDAIGAGPFSQGLGRRLGIL